MYLRKMKTLSKDLTKDERCPSAGGLAIKKLFLRKKLGENCYWGSSQNLWNYEYRKVLSDFEPPFITIWKTMNDPNPLPMC